MRTLLLAAMLCPLLSGCGDDGSVAGGSGTEAGSGLAVQVLSPDGAPVVGAIVEAWPVDQLPGDSGSEPVARDTTGFDGTAVLPLRGEGWSVLARRGDEGFRRVAAGGSLSVDTLRPFARISGTVPGGIGARVAVVGLGRSVACDTGGRYHLDGLPSGEIRVAVAARAGDLRVVPLRLAPGVGALLELDSTASTPQSSPDFVLDSLGGVPLPYRMPPGALDSTGAFAVAVRALRDPASDTSWMISWGPSDGGGVRLGWIGADTLALEVGGTLHRIAGIEFGTAARNVGLAWSPATLDVRLDTALVVSMGASTLAARSGWESLVVGSSGLVAIEWVARRSGAPRSDWFSALPGD